MHEPLSAHHERTYQALVGHPAAHDVHWHDLRSMLGAIAEIVEGPNGKLKAVRNGRTLTLPRASDSGVASPGELNDVRRFLEESGQPPEPKAAGVHMLVIIDHREARVYRTEERGSVPERIVPHRADRFLHNVQDEDNGQRKPEDKGFYESVVGALHGAESVLLFGAGTGASSAMNHLLEVLKLQHKELGARVVGAHVVDEHHQTEEQLLGAAREFYAKIAAP